MSDRIFQDAYARVRSRYSQDAWSSLNPRQITDAIYKEIRLIDAERMRAHEDGTKTTGSRKANLSGGQPTDR